MHPEPCTVDRGAQARDPRQEEQRDRPDAEEVLVLLEDAVVAAQAPECDGEQHDADDDPEALLERVAHPEPVDLGDADRGQEPGHRQQVRIGVRHRDARDDVRGDVEREEEDGIAERAPADERLAGDVDRREADPGQDADDGEVDELSVAVAEAQRASPHQTSATITAINAAITASARRRLPMPACGGSGLWAAIAA